MPLQATSGAASYDAFGGGVAAVPNYIEDVFSTYLYTGNGSTQTITNGIDLAGKGGLQWGKLRSGADDHYLTDTARGTGYYLYSDGTFGNIAAGTTGISSFTSTGYTLGAGSYQNTNGANFVSWTFRKQPKFFDVVTYTGNGAAGQTINHNLGSVPGFMVVKRTNTTGDWAVYHRSLGATQICFLNDTQAAGTTVQAWNNTEPTSTQFTVGVGYNASGSTYVAYLFAHNAGGFGLTGTDNVISCGSYTISSGTGTTEVNLGFEPQWLLDKPVTDPGFATNWNMYDTMRGWVNNPGGGNVNSRLSPNTSNAEASNNQSRPTATGFTLQNSAVYPGVPITYIYIAIRRGPMKVPTSGTSVFKAQYGSSGSPSITTPFVVDSVIDGYLYGGYFGSQALSSRLTGSTYLASSSTAAESNSLSSYIKYDYSNGAITTINDSHILYALSRAPSFFDEVCYTGTGSATTQTHNLGVVPELIIVKGRSAGTSGVNWSCYHSALGNTQVISLNEDIQAYTSTQWNNTTPTSSVFSVGTQTNVNGSGQTYVAYLFATCAGVSKVGSYTGTGTTQQVNCGFTGGARFILIKRTDEVASGNPWYVWDSARGIVAGNDPYLLLNSTAAEVTNTDYVDAYSAGFEISSTAPSSINASGGTFIYLAIA